MKYTLMHKNVKVADIEIDREILGITKIYNCLCPEHLPVGVGVNKFGIERGALNEWLKDRAIPASRDNINVLLDKIGGSRVRERLLFKCYALSLSDQYWVRPDNSNLKWSEINFFENAFSSDVGELLFGNEPINAEYNLISPDNTSDGWLKKKWIIAGGKRVLVKAGSGDFQQEPYNEVIASALMTRLAIPHVEYKVIIDKSAPYSICDNFLSASTESVPAALIRAVRKKPNNESDLTHFLRCAELLGSPDCSDMINKMLITDYIIANSDRHYNNFSLMRDPETLKWIGFSPIYDNGNSLWYQTAHVGNRTECKPFRSSHDEQIKLVTDLSWFEIERLKNFREEVEDIFSTSDTVDVHRAEAIAQQIQKRAQEVDRIKTQKAISVAAAAQHKTASSLRRLHTANEVERLKSAGIANLEVRYSDKSGTWIAKFDKLDESRVNAALKPLAPDAPTQYVPRR